MGFLSTYDGASGPARVGSGKSNVHAICEVPLGIPLQSLKGPRSSTGAEVRTSGFLSSADMDLGVPMEFQQGNQASTRSERWKAVGLSTCQNSIRLPVELT